VTRVRRPFVQTAIVCMATLVMVLCCEARQAPAPTQTAVQELYRQLRTVPLDPTLIFKIREATIDREDLHLYLTDGVICFTKTVEGRVTGAFFEGQGEVLVRPPDNSERASLGLFTGQGVLDEQFTSAYIRFNDTTATDLQSSLRQIDDSGPEFLAKYAETAQNLAMMDGLRMLSSFTSHYPQDRFLHARLGGTRLGVFDVSYDAMAEEQISVGKFQTNDLGTFYDIWMSFAARSARNLKDPESRVIDPWRSSEAVKVNKFSISSTLIPPQTIQAKADLALNVRHGGQRLLFFELSRYLKVEKVTFGAQTLEFLQNESVDGTQLARRGNDLVVIVFPKPLRDGESLQLHFEYAGNVMAQAGPGLLYVGARGTWYPNRGISMSNFDLEFRWPSEWTLVATGKRVSLDADGNDLVGRWVSEVPMPLAGFNLGQYTKNSAKAGTVTVDSFAANSVEYNLPLKQTEALVVKRPAVPGGGAPQDAVVVAPPLTLDPARNGKKIAETCAHAIENYTRWFGPYPYSSLNITQFPSSESQGWPGLIFLSSTAFLPPAEQTRVKLDDFGRVLYGDLMPWHETAHMWWGDVVFWRTYRDQWLVEALSNYSALMILERENPASFKVAMDRYRTDLLSRAPNGRQYLEAGPVNLGLRLSSSEFPNGYFNISYGRGTWLLHMLRTMLDDTQPKTAAGSEDLFLKVLRTLRERYAFKEATTDDLQKVFEEYLPASLRYEGSKSLDWFFQGWVNGTAIPSLQLANVKISGRGEKVAANFTIEQKDAPNDLVTSVPIYAELSGNRRVFVGRVFADGDETKLRLPVPAGTKRLLLDPMNTVLRRP
jgi:hypothetical protein